jgi:hydrogenase expression/formation protein HypC
MGVEMCLAVPSKIIELKGPGLAIADTLGTRRLVALDLLEDPPAVGDYVIVHVGYAIQRLDPKDALETIDLFMELLQKEEEEADYGRYGKTP